MVVRLPDGAPLAPADPLAGTANDPAIWRIGPYVVDLRITGTDGRIANSNRLAIALAPRSTAAAAADPGGTEITLTSEPPIRPGQSVAILVGQEMALVDRPVAALSQVQAVLPGLTSGSAAPVRLRVDGIDSPVINLATDPPSLETVMIP